MKQRVIKFFSNAILVLLVVIFCLSSLTAYAAPMTSDKVEALIEQSLEVMRAHYINPHRADDVAHYLQSKLERGDYDDIHTLTQFAESVGRDIRLSLNDDHMSLYVKAPNQQASHVLTHPQGKLTHNGGFEQVSYLANNTGYLKFNKFSPDNEAKATVDHALGFLSSADAIIIDLRDTVGGSPELVQYFLSHLLSSNTELWQLYGQGDELLETHCASAVNPQRISADTPLLLLTSHHTASAAELFAAVLQAQGRALVIGETTAGAGHLVGVRNVTDELVFRLSLIKPVVSATGESWEAKGVEPQLKVPALDALERAQLWLRNFG